MEEYKIVDVNGMVYYVVASSLMEAMQKVRGSN